MKPGGISRSAVLAVTIATAVCTTVFALAGVTFRHFTHKGEYEGRSAEAWSMDINGADREATEAARDALKEMGEDAVPKLIKQLESPGSDSRARLRAVQALGYIGRKAGSAVPALLKAADDPDPNVRHAALNSLDRSPVDPAKAAPVYVRLLSDTSPKVRYTAAQRLRHIPGEAKKIAVPALLKACEDSDQKVREAAQSVLNALNVPLPNGGNGAVPPPPAN